MARGEPRWGRDTQRTVDLLDLIRNNASWRETFFGDPTFQPQAAWEVARDISLVLLPLDPAWMEREIAEGRVKREGERLVSTEKWGWDCFDPVRLRLQT